MAWKGLFQHLKKSLMDDYHEFKHVHEAWIKEWWMYRLPNYVSITEGTYIPKCYYNNNNSIIGSKNVKNVTTRIDSANLSTSGWGLFTIFNPIVEFFQKLWRNCQKVWMEKLWNLQEFQCKLHENLHGAYTWMRKLIIMAQRMTKT